MSVQIGVITLGEDSGIYFTDNYEIEVRLTVDLLTRLSSIFALKTAAHMQQKSRNGARSDLPGQKVLFGIR